MEVKYKLNVRDRTIFRVHVEVLCILHKLEFTKTMKAVFSELLYENNKHKSINSKDRGELLLNTTNRKNIVQSLNIDTGTFNNIISMFRRIEGNFGLILIDKVINEDYCIYPENSNKIIIDMIKKIDNKSESNETEIKSN